jgi:asparagine synthase (glutamine-hydrolysing)
VCGIAGIVGLDSQCQEVGPRLLKSMHHRGPDDYGIHSDPASYLLLVHTRLAIIDLSPAGHQPMQTLDGRFTIVFNGEIYNHAQLREQLEREGIVFRGHSDTEVLLHLYAQHREKMLTRLEGMFAFAIWDNQTRELFLARDPHGIKPLYYWGDGECFAFASELRTLLEIDRIPRKLDVTATARYLMYGSVQDPDTLIQDIKQLGAASWMRVKDGRVVTSDSYWSFQYEPQITEPRDATQQLRACLNDSIRRHFVSDVPVGIFLSGGIDSTAITALANANGFRDLQTFCISFDDPAFDESDIAQRTAKHFGTTHHDWRMTSQLGQEMFVEYLDRMDLPSNDGLNTFCVSRMVQKAGMKVVLSGLGGDEQFGGYPSFKKIPVLANLHRRLGWIGRTAGLAANALGATAMVNRPSSMKRVVEFLRSSGGYDSAYWTMRGFLSPREAIDTIEDITGNIVRLDSRGLSHETQPMPENSQDKVALLESTLYMRNQLLRDSDAMSMANGLELRVPFVDRKLTDLLNRVTPEIRYETGKRFLLSAVPEVPEWVAKQPKRGFRFPLEQWVTKDWEREFETIEQQTRVYLGAWYRKWVVFVLKRFMERHGVNA